MNNTFEDLKLWFVKGTKLLPSKHANIIFESCGN